MNFPAYRPPDKLADILAQLQAAKSVAATLDDLNRNRAANPSQRIELTVVSLEHICNAIALIAALQRETQADIADLHVKVYERDLNAENQVLAYPSIYQSVGEAMKRASDATDGFTASQALIVALNFVIGMVDSLMVTTRYVRSKVARFETMATELRTLREDFANLERKLEPVVAREELRQSDISRWEDDALKGGGDGSSS